MRLLLLLLERLARPLVLCQPPSDRTSLLCSEVEGEELLALVVLAQVLSRLVVHHGQYPGNRLADSRDLCELGRRSTSDLLHPQSEELVLQLDELLGQVILGLGLELVSLDLAGHFG